MVATEFVMQPQCEPNVVSVSEIVRSKGDKHPPPRVSDQHTCSQIGTIFVCIPHMISDQNYRLCVYIYAACVSGRV